MAAGFSLEKWYLDCTTEDGDCAIGYHAQLSLGKRAISYSALLSSISKRIRNSTTYRQCPAPVLASDSRITWHAPTLDFNGTWDALCPSYSKILLDTHDGGIVEWECLMPLAKTTVRLRDNTFVGNGYCERLRLTLPPWKLPIRELRWGRFTSQEASVVWIEWIGDVPLKIILYNGAEQVSGSIGDTSIQTSDFTLELTPEQTLREGYVVHTALRNFPGIKSILPTQARNLFECKWLSKGILTIGEDVQYGQAIHEVVRW